MELFRRLPKRHPLPREEQQLIPLGERSQYLAFQKDFEILDKHLMPAFRELDNRALIRQNRYRLIYVLLIFGGAAVTILGIVQLAFTNLAWIGIIGAVIAAVLAFATAMLENFKDHESYLNARLAAEQLRREYFLFLGRGGQYRDEQTRMRNLIQQVLDIKTQGENA